MLEIKIQGHRGESSRDDECKHPYPDRFDQRRVLRMIDAKRLESALEAMIKVKADRYHAQQVEEYQQDVLKGDGYGLVKVFHDDRPRSLVGIRKFNLLHILGIPVRHLLAEDFSRVQHLRILHVRKGLVVELVPEVAHVYHDIDQENRAKHRHIAARPGRLVPDDAVLHIPRFPVGNLKVNTPAGVEENKKVIQVGNDFDRGKSSHHHRVGIECIPPVILEKLKITDKVHYQEKT